MGCTFRIVVLFLVCCFEKVKPEVGAGSNSKVEVILQESRAVNENLTEQMDALASYLSESVNRMKSMEARFMKAYQKHRGINSNKTYIASTHGGAVYTRWGNDTCPLEAELAYRGFAASGHYSHSGAGSNVVCAHGEPQFEKSFYSNTSKYNYLYGAEYEDIWRPDVHDNDVPCAVCRSWSRASAIMVPGRHECMKSWHTEYWGFLVGPKSDDPGNAEYICLDSNPHSIEGGFQDHDGRTLYNVKYYCGSLPCPPYKNYYFAPCAICTK